MRSRTTILFFAVIAAAFAGCQPPEGGPDSVARYGTLSAGTELVLSLLRQLEAGRAREGEKVPLVVSRDVRDAQGNVLIPQGSVVNGEVSWSRSEGSLSGIANQPARLAIRVPEMRTPDGEEVRLVAHLDKPDEPFMFTRANTGLPDGNGLSTIDGGEPAERRPEIPDMARSLHRQEMERVRAEIESALSSGDFDRLADKEFRLAFERVADRLGLPETKKIVEAKTGERCDLDSAKAFVHGVESGTLVKLAAPEFAAGLSALKELGIVAREIDSKVRGMLKGRTIRAYVGTPVRVFVAESKRMRVAEQPAAGSS